MFPNASKMLNEKLFVLSSRGEGPFPFSVSLASGTEALSTLGAVLLGCGRVFLAVVLRLGGHGLLDEFGLGGTCKLLGGVDSVNCSRLLKVYPNLLELSNAPYTGSESKYSNY